MFDKVWIKNFWNIIYVLFERNKFKKNFIFLHNVLNLDLKSENIYFKQGARKTLSRENIYSSILTHLTGWSLQLAKSMGCLVIRRKHCFLKSTWSTFIINSF